MDTSGKHHRIIAGISVLLISVVRVIIGFLLSIFVFFLFLLGAATVFWLVNHPDQIMFSLTFIPMVIFSFDSL